MLFYLYNLTSSSEDVSISEDYSSLEAMSLGTTSDVKEKFSAVIGTFGESLSPHFISGDLSSYVDEEYLSPKAVLFPVKKLSYNFFFYRRNCSSRILSYSDFGFF